MSHSQIKLFTDVNGTYIPVTEAAVVNGYRCPFTKRIFTSKNKYVAHLKSYRQTVIHPRIEIARWNDRLKEFVWVNTFNDVVEWVKNNPSFFYDAAVRRNSHNVSKKNKREDFEIEITYLDLHWDPHVSNSHHAPVGQQTNWSRREKDKAGNPLATGFPGWEGRIEYKVNQDLGFGSDYFGGIPIHPGTGGSRGMVDGYEFYSFDVRFFYEDWPGIKQMEIINILGDTHVKRFTYGTARR